MNDAGPLPEFTLALAGNPNAGKTTIFNALTGERRHVGNYPGVTVERVEGEMRFEGAVFRVVDLPGTYSLSAYSAEERVAREVLLNTPPDAVIAVLDASNLDRHLYLAVQLMELGLPLVLALNMSDVAARRGLRVDAAALSALLGVPVVPTVGHRGEGLADLRRAAARVCRAGRQDARPIAYGAEIEPHLAQLERLAAAQPGGAAHARGFALALLEGDPEAAARLRRLCPDAGDGLLREAARLRTHLETVSGADIGTVLADARYGFIAGACAESVTRAEPDRLTRSEQIDRVALSRWLGLPLFALLMYAVFQAIFALGAPLTRALEALFAWLAGLIAAAWPAGAPALGRSLLTDGIVGGVGGVVTFLPNILLLFLAIALLEDTGYMARAAYLMDALMHRIGLHGKSFIPMLIGFGCTVPAILATRTLETRRDRLTTILVLPLMSCGARLAIYALLIPAFFPERLQAPVLWLLYLIGIALAAGLAWLLRQTIFRGDEAAFVMELPPYRVPTLKGALLHTWERGRLFLRKAGTLILGASILLWALSVWPRPGADAQRRLDAGRQAIAARAGLPAPERQALLERHDAAAAQAALEHSAVGRLGRLLAPAFRPLGFDWQVATALLGAVAAKELFVAQMAIVHAVGTAAPDAPGTLRDALRARYTPLQAFCMMLFCLVSLPCVATVAATRQETGAWRWAVLQAGGLTLLAWGITAVVYQAGRLLLP